MDDIQINKIIEQYKATKQKQHDNYHNKYKLDEDYIKRNRQRAKEHYNLNIDKRKDKYESNKEYAKARSSYNYYKRIDKLDKFKDKYPDRFKMINDRTTVLGQQQLPPPQQPLVVHFD